MMNISGGLHMVPSLENSRSHQASPTMHTPRSRLAPRPRSSSRDDGEGVHSSYSLPLKKRRLLHLQQQSFQDDLPTSADINTDLSSVKQAVNGRIAAAARLCQSPSDTSALNKKTEDEKLAALALICASSIVHNSNSSPVPESPIPMAARPTQSFPQPLQDDDSNDVDPFFSAAIAITCLATPRSTDRSIMPFGDAGAGGAVGPSLGRYVTDGTNTATGTTNFVSPLPVVKQVPLQCHPADASATSSLSMSSSSSEDEHEENQDQVMMVVADDEDDHEEPSSQNGDVEDDEEVNSTANQQHLLIPAATAHPPGSGNSNCVRLTSPLPNGCHGRTSRYNSFCRRQPCFNGSNYCKFHYSLHEKKKSPSKTPLEPAAAHVAIASAKKSKATLPVPALPKNFPTAFYKAVNSVIASKSSSVQQDKRFTGSPGEIRCQATTTRGRACAYVAVCGDDNDLNMKYCHLHEDYDKNPPARRNKAALIVSTTSLMQKGSKVFVVGKCKTKAGKSAADQEDCEGTAQSFPLLSMLSTDVWFDKRVIVSTGPFMNRTGHVLRWGNGWVTVKLDSESDSSMTGKKGVDDAIHNRRSFELFLHPDQKLDEGKTSRTVVKT